jgi:protein SCO1/2
MPRIAAAALLATIALWAAGAGAVFTLLWPSAPARFQAADITGVPWGKGFDLVDATGHRRTLADFRGKVVVLSFGYTSCPDACPTTLALVGQAMKDMDVDADRVQGLFVTVDPTRDTPQVLSRYVPAFYPSFLGLYADTAATERVAREFRIYYHANPPAADGFYTIDHSEQVYVFDRVGRLRLLVKPDASTPESIAHDVRLLLRETG